MWNPRKAANPDSQWIRNWDSLPDTEGYNESDKVFQVLGTALVKKANRAGCEADYKAEYDRRKKAADELDGKITEVLKEPAAHDRIHELVLLRPQDSKSRLVGARFRLERELGVQADVQARKDAFAWLHMAAIDSADIRPLLSVESESKYACLQSGEFYFEEERTAITDEIKNSKALPPNPSKAPDLVSLTDNREFKVPFMGIETAKVGSITRSGTGGTITYESSRDDTFIVSCKNSTTRVVIENNTVRPDKSCTYGTITYANSVKLTFADLPKMAIEKGDELEMLSQITEHSLKSTKSGATKKRDERKFAGEGIFVVSVKRGDKVIWKLRP
ncbi:MAG: hypothetical protein IPK82_37995 [Polyangiaceae bacterium]|nr:hypothetical protein [Polyangiaceae bacterium]